MGELLATGDAATHIHDLPPVPSLTRYVPAPDGGEPAEVKTKLENAVARCFGCGRLFVSRHADDGWSGGIYWVRLRWWHRKAWAKLRVLEAARIGGVAE